MQSLVSVIMPAYNAEEYIGEAISSILSQTYEKLELIVVEDCSTDNTIGQIDKYRDDNRIVVIKNPVNKGISYSTNTGIGTAKGKYIALLDDDDMAAVNRIELQVDYLEKHLEIDILGGWTETIDSAGNHMGYYAQPRTNPKYIKALLLFGWWGFGNGTTMIRRDFLEESGLRYEDNCYGIQDLRFFMKASKIGTISAIPDLLLYKREHGKNESDYRHEKYGIERDETYRRFRTESLKESGIDLKEMEYATLNDLLSDLNVEKKISDLEILYGLLRKILVQAKQKADFYKELEHVCRKMLVDYLMQVYSFSDI